MKCLSFKKILLPLILLLSISGNAISQKVGTWKTYMAYHNASIVKETGSLVFGVYDGSLLSYDPEYDEVITYGFEHGLSDTGITLLEYSPDHNALIIVYKNCNIDIFYGSNNVVNLASVKNKPLENKEIYNIDIAGDYAYLPSGFGIVVLDLKRNVIKETYDLDTQIRAVYQSGDYLYAATNAGFKKGLLSLNLIDKEKWEDIGADELNYPGTYQNIKKMFSFKGQLVVQEINKIYYQDLNGTMREWWSGAIRHTTVIDDILIMSLYNRVDLYTDFGRPKQQIATTTYYVDSHNSPGKYWMANGEDGIVRISLNIENGNSEVLVSDIVIDSPMSNSSYYLTYTQGKLLVTAGGKKADTNRLDNQGALMVLEDGHWTNFDAREIEKQLGMEEGKCRDFMMVAVDPTDANHYYVSSWGEGIYEFRDNVCITRFTGENSSIESALNLGDGYYKINGMAFDRNGDLYVVNDEVVNGLSILSAGGSWKSYYYQPLSSENIESVLVDRNNVKWINKTRTKGAGIGIMVLDDNGNYYFSTRFADQQGENVGAAAFNCFAEDNNGYVWVGTDVGPIRFSGADDINSGRCYRIIGTDEIGEGYRLLEGVPITTIAIDGGNRKWIGTTGSGVYMLDDTQSTLYVENFTTTNSLLISNNITSIAINDRTGEVYIGTDNGLMSYQSDAVEGYPNYSDIYAYPNPVYPDRQSAGVIINGLMSDSSIKITDLAGNLIAQGTSIGGMYRWNCTNIKGETVKSGIYLVFAAQSDGSEGVVTKIMVIR